MYKPTAKSDPNHQLYLRSLARMSPSQRVEKAFELSDLTKQLLKEGLRRRFPEMNPSELHAIYLQRLERCHNNNY